MPNIAPSVLGAAVINIVGNMSGFRTAMGETRTQMYGLITVANAVGGKISGGLLTGIFAHGGMSKVHAAMQTASTAMSTWQAAKPATPVAPSSMMALTHPAQYQAAMARYNAAMAALPGRMAIWNAAKPNMEALKQAVQTAALAHGKMLLFSAAIVGVGASLMTAIPYASEFNEQINKMIHTFGQSSTALIEKATGASSMGLGKSEYLQGASTLGIELLGSGMNEKAAEGLTEKLVERSSDLASFADIQVSTVLDKIRSGLAGFGRPLKELGINITEGRVEAKAASMGLREHNGYLSEESKLRARAALILQLSNHAAGDFARTQGGYANQMRILGANWSNFMAEMGVFGMSISSIFLPLLNKMVEGFGWLSKRFNENILMMAAARQGVSMDQMKADQKYLDDETKRGVSLDNKWNARQIKEDERNAQKHKIGTTDLVGYARALQDSVSGGGIPGQQLQQLKDINQALKDQAKKRRGPNFAPGTIAPEFPM